ncbi:EAL domain-containing protein [Halomonas sp. E14]|uniref:EAL domain-containing protein n=1 Tax=Halomonas sp. E14 TaxID=3397245 RepID=UPI00403E9A12
MPNNTQQVARHTWLVLVPVLLLAMGLINGLAGWYLPGEWQPSAASLPVMTLVGGGLLAATLQRVRLAQGCGVLLLGLGLSSPLAALLPSLADFLMLGTAPFSPAASIALLMASACLMGGTATPRARLGWFWVGIAICLIGALSVLSVVWPYLVIPSPWGQAFTTPFTALPALLCGTAMLLLSRRSAAPLALNRAAVLALVGGVLASSLAWYALTWQQADAQRRHAAELLIHFKGASERAVDGQQRSLQRLAERWANLGGLPPASYRATESATYFRDMPELLSLYWQAQDETFGPGRDRDAELRLPEWVQLGDAWLLDWLAVGGPYPRWVLPDRDRPELTLVVVPLPEPADGRVVALVDLRRLVERELSALVTPLTLTVWRNDVRLVDNRQDQASEGRLLHSTSIVLPGGVRLLVQAHDAQPAMVPLAALMPLGVALGGLLLSYLLAFSLGMASLGRRRSLALAQAQRYLRAQQRVQTMIARDQPLADTLKAVCRLVEAQAPGAIASIMLCDETGTLLSKVYTVSLPESWCTALRDVRIGPGNGACGRAAYLREFVVCANIAEDAKWRGFHAAAEAHGLRACWSYPVMASDGRLLGTFAIYSAQPGEPQRSDRRRIVEAAELVSLAVEREQNRRALRESEQRYRSLFTYHPDAVFSLDLAGRFVSANAACSEVTGYRLESLIGQHFDALIEPADRERLRDQLRAAGEGEAFRYSLTVSHAEGHSVYLDLTNLPMVVEGKVIGYYGIAKDMTERHRRDTELRILQRSVEASINGIVIADARAPGLPMIYANEAFERITGYRRSEIIGQGCSVLQGSETDPQAIDQMRRALAEQRELSVTLCNYRKDGTPFWNNLYLAPVRDFSGEVTHFVGVLHDISERKAYEAKLSYHASHDALTGLANRALFEDRLLHDVQLAQRHGRQLAVLYVDLDDFKPINDSLGHEVGDKVLIDVARRVAKELDPGDTLARFGGDEFVILLPELRSEDAALRLAERLLASIGRPFRVEEHELYIGASVGVAFLKEELANPVELIQQADMAMYRAKQKGRNAWECYTREINAEVSSRMALRNDLQEAIEAGDFELHYQPLLWAEDASVAGFEALVRWKHPVKGYLSPGLFIPLAEETGQIAPISEWVLRQACRDMRRLGNEGYGRFRVAVNLSPLQFHRPNFLDKLKRALLETGLEPDYLELELTEGILMNDTAAAVATLHQLRDMGVEVSIDDFGTGYSSLSYLKQLPIGKIKIDRSFIREVTTNPHDSAIVQGIISMAHHLGLEVVAEGIEEAEQRDFLAAHGCDVLQGFFFAKPMPLDQLRAYLERQGYRSAGAKVAFQPADR